MNFAFYGQAKTTDRRAARIEHARQRAAAAARAQRLGGQIVADYFDVYPDRFTSLAHRRQARRLLQTIEDEHREFGALVIADTDTTLTATQYEDLLFTTHQHGVQLLVPEIDEPVDPDNAEHQAIMKDVFRSRPHWQFEQRDQSL